MSLRDVAVCSTDSRGRNLVHAKYQYMINALWIAHPVLQLGVVGAMFRRKLHRTFPFFFAYIVSQVVFFAVVFPAYLSDSYTIYFYASWATTAVSVALGFMVIHEIFVDIFRPYHTLKDLGSVLFKWAGLVMLLVAGVVVASSPASDQGPLVQAILTLQSSVRVIQCGLVLFVLVFSQYLGISWRQRSFGIALGFGGFAALELVLVALLSGGYLAGGSGERITSLVNTTGYNFAIATWLVYALLNNPGREAQEVLLKSQRWEQSLSEIQHPASADSLIPLFENMVERALSRTPNVSPKFADNLSFRGTLDPNDDEAELSAPAARAAAAARKS